MHRTIFSALFILTLSLLMTNCSDNPVSSPDNNASSEGGTLSAPQPPASQVWMVTNLDVTTYRNGDPIPQVTDPTQWANLTTGAWCYPNNDPAMGAIYGKLYNWYAVNDPRGLAPAGWHVPTDKEWKTYEMSLGMTKSQADATGWRGTDEGGKLKETGTTHWITPNTGATNSSGFTGLPSGFRNTTFNKFGFQGSWWTSTQSSGTSAWSRSLYYVNAWVARGGFSKGSGLSVRCVQN